MNQHAWWYLARASGVVAWSLVTGSVVLGLWLSLRLTRRRPRPAWTLDLHRFLGGLAVVFTGVHLSGLVADSYVHFGAAELFVPFASSWQGGAVAWGIVGLYLLLAIELTSLAMRHLPRKLWRGVHLTSYVLFVFATIHMLSAGTDASSPPLQWLALFGVGAVAFLSIVRVLSTRRSSPTPRSGPKRLAPTDERLAWVSSEDRSGRARTLQAPGAPARR